MIKQSSATEQFRALHGSGCFVLPNPWDVGSAVYLEYLGFKALATTSAGYAFESASAVMAYGRDVLGLERIVAITSPDNEASIKVLNKLGLEFERMIRLSEGSPEVKLFAPLNSRH